jgi:tRNA threonylcarbamoyladenosine biosynthesis protein TsaE
LVQAIAASCGVGPGQVVSPTFVLCQEYHGSRDIFHLDAYRLRDDDEFLQLGPEEYFDSDGLILIEWADRVEKCLPRSRLRIEIDAVSESDRVFRITGVGNPAWNEVIESIQQRLGVYGS